MKGKNPDTQWRMSWGTDHDGAVAFGIRYVPCQVCGRGIHPEEDCFTRFIGSGLDWTTQYLCWSCEEKGWT